MQHARIRTWVAAALALGLAAAHMGSPAAAQDLKAFEKKVTTFTLDNGLAFVVVEDHSAPVISFHTYANVGSVDEIKGITGMAHMFEHMAFKGTTTIGTTDPEAERACMDEVDAIYDELRYETAKGSRADPDRIAQLETEFRKADEACREFIVPAEYDKILTGNGGTGLNATTWFDWTRYLVNLPSNKLELWMSLESERWLDPVLREFYQEKDVVTEERRMRTDNQPFGKLLEEVVATSFKAHPYGEPTIGHMSDIHSYTREEARQWFMDYYGPDNLTVALVGDVDPAEAEHLAGIYFGRLERRGSPPLVETVEPPQLGERRVTIEDPAQPLVAIAYHKTDGYHPDNVVFQAIDEILGAGRTSRLHTRLVKEEKIAVATGIVNGFFGERFPEILLVYAVPAQGHTAAECEAAILDEIEKLKTEPVASEELEKAKRRSRAALVRRLEDRADLAWEVAADQALYGDWRRVFTDLEDLQGVTLEDIQRVSKEYFGANNRTVGSLVTTQADTQPES
jgi:predicted Zn-dependent peptidase